MSEASTPSDQKSTVRPTDNTETDAFIGKVVEAVVERFSGDTAAYFASLTPSRQAPDKIEQQDSATRGFLKSLST